MATSIDQQFIEYIVKSLVGHPDAVKVERRIDEKGVLLELTVDVEDLGRVIGKRGATAQSLRTLLRALGTKNDARYNLKIIDVGEPPERRERSEESRPEEPREEVGEERQDQLLTDMPTEDTSAPASDSTDDVDMTEDEDLPETPAERDHSDVVSRTRKELEELDDLDV
jgi:uncharacterized protein